MKLADRWLPRRQPEPPAPRPTFTPAPRPPRPRQVRSQGRAPTTAQPILRPVAVSPPGPRRYQPPTLDVLRRVARALRQSQSRQQRFWDDYQDLPIFRRSARGHVATLYVTPRPVGAVTDTGMAAQWAEQSLRLIAMQCSAAWTEANVRLAAIKRDAMAALQPPSQLPAHPPRMGVTPGAGRVPEASPSHRANSVRGRPSQPISQPMRLAPGKIFREGY